MAPLLMKKARSLAQSERRILWGAKAFFVALVLLLAWAALWQAADLQQSIQADFHTRARLTAQQTANSVASAINARFGDLQFLKNLVFDSHTSGLLPNAQTLSAFTAFQRTHPGIAAINIQDPSGNRVVWSSRNQPAKPIASGRDFTALPQHSGRLIGKAIHDRFANAWILPMRQRIEDNEGHVLGFIGSPFLLSNLNAIHIPTDLQSILLTNSGGQVISVWQDGHWAPPDTRLPPPAGEITLPVPDYPWVLHVQWTTAAMHQAFWQVERERLPIVLSALLFLVAMGVFTQKVLRQLLRLRQYQAAALLAQQNILRQDGPQAMYQQLVDVVVAQTEAIGAYIVVSEADSEWLRVVAAAADEPALQAAMEQLTPSKDPAHSPYGDMVPSRAFREKIPQGPVNPHRSAAMMAMQKQHVSLSRIQSAMAFPIFMCENPEPSAVLVIESDLPEHFTQPLRQLLEQLANTLGLALTQWGHHRELKEAAAEIHQMAFYDTLTGLPNRRLLESHLEQDMARAERHDQLLAVCMLDLDDFKPINDTYGHEAGDEVLVALGQRLHESLRKSDFIARLGGDEFVLLVDELASLDDLAQILTNVENAISAPIALSNGKTVQVHASMGVTLHPGGGKEAPDQLLRFADQALYESKANKADRKKSWVLFRSEFQKRQTPAQRLLAEGRLEVWYQPILDNRMRKVVGLEALARLRDNDGRILIPGEFLPHLATVDLTDLSRLVLTQALADLAILDTRGWSLWVSFNVTPETFSRQYVPCLQGIIAASGIDPSRITLEILEGGDFLERDTALSVLHEIKDLGIRLALDDVGSAYASLLRLKELPVDEIKLDQGFISTLEERPQDLHFVGAIQDLAAGMGVDLVVEGVETDDILDAVTAMGVTFLQGNAIAKPMQLVQLQAFLDHPPSHHRQHPTGLLGLYAAQFTHHNTLKKTIQQSPRLMDFAALVDATTCPIHDDLHRLGADDGGPLDQLHREYHRAIAVMDAPLTSSPADDDWSAVEQAQKAFSKAIIEAFLKKKTAESSASA